jgi:hypothetical protein
MRTPKAVLSALALSFLGASVALAHGGHDHTLRVVAGPNQVGLNMRVHPDLFIQFDSDQNGEISIGEYRQQLDQINDFVDQHLRIVDSEGQIATPTMRDLTAAHVHNMDDDEALPDIRIVRMFSNLEASPAHLALSLVEGWDGTPPPYRIRTVSGQGKKGQLSNSQDLIPLG